MGQSALFTCQIPHLLAAVGGASEAAAEQRIIPSCADCVQRVLLDALWQAVVWSMCGWGGSGAAKGPNGIQHVGEQGLRSGFWRAVFGAEGASLVTAGRVCVLVFQGVS